MIWKTIHKIRSRIGRKNKNLTSLVTEWALGRRRPPSFLFLQLIKRPRSPSEFQLIGGCSLHFFLDGSSPCNRLGRRLPWASAFSQISSNFSTTPVIPGRVSEMFSATVLPISSCFCVTFNRIGNPLFSLTTHVHGSQTGIYVLATLDRSWNRSLHGLRPKGERLLDRLSSVASGAWAYIYPYAQVILSTAGSGPGHVGVACSWGWSW